MVVVGDGSTQDNKITEGRKTVVTSSFCGQLAPSRRRNNLVTTNKYSNYYKVTLTSSGTSLSLSQEASEPCILKKNLSNGHCLLVTHFSS